MSTKKQAGRPRIGKYGEVKIQANAKIEPSLRDKLVKQYGSLSKALESLDNTPTKQ